MAASASCPRIGTVLDIPAVFADDDDDVSEPPESAVRSAVDFLNETRDHRDDDFVFVSVVNDLDSAFGLAVFKSLISCKLPQPIRQLTISCKM